jgi:sugar lactone lactonase YvrE
VSTEPEPLHSSRFADGFTFGEGPRWHDGRLWFTDGPAGAVKALDDGGRIEVQLEANRPSGLGWLPDGTLVISSLMAAAVELVGPDGSRRAYDLDGVAWSTNDLLADSTGRVYLDLYRGDDATGDAIGLLTPDGDVRIVAEALATPNGLAVLPDQTTLVVSETFGSRILAFEIASDGGLGEPRTFADLGDRHPDGLCVDVEGGVWVGCYDTGEFLRVLDGGRITHRIEIATGWAVAPALGGADGRSLFLVVDETSHEQLVAGESTGRIELATVDVPGIGSP